MPSKHNPDDVPDRPVGMIRRSPRRQYAITMMSVNTIRLLTGQKARGADQNRLADKAVLVEHQDVVRSNHGW